MKLIALVLVFGVHSLGSEECHVNLNSDMTSMLQVAQKNDFCSDFYEEKDLDIASQGLEPAKFTFMEYCTSNASSDIDCEMIAADVFDDAEGLDEKLCDKLMTLKVMLSGVHADTQFLESHETTNQETTFTSGGICRMPTPDFTRTTPLEDPGNDRNRESSWYDASDAIRYYSDAIRDCVGAHCHLGNSVVRIASVRYRRNSQFNECIEMGCMEGSFSECRRQLHSLLNDRNIVWHAALRRNNLDGRACGPYYNSYHSSPRYSNSRTPSTYSYAAIYRHTSDQNVGSFRNRWNPSQGRYETSTRLVAVTYTQDGEHRCAEMGSLPNNDDAYQEFVDWLAMRFEEGGATNTGAYPRAWSRASALPGFNDLGFACGPQYNQYLQSYFFSLPVDPSCESHTIFSNLLDQWRPYYTGVSGAHVVVWRAT